MSARHLKKSSGASKLSRTKNFETLFPMNPNDPIYKSGIRLCCPGNGYIDLDQLAYKLVETTFDIPHTLLTEEDLSLVRAGVIRQLLKVGVIRDISIYETPKVPETQKEKREEPPLVEREVPLVPVQETFQEVPVIPQVLHTTSIPEEKEQSKPPEGKADPVTDHNPSVPLPQEHKRKNPQSSTAYPTKKLKKLKNPELTGEQRPIESHTTGDSNHYSVTGHVMNLTDEDKPIFSLGPGWKAPWNHHKLERDLDPLTLESWFYEPLLTEIYKAFFHRWPFKLKEFAVQGLILDGFYLDNPG